MEIDTEALQVLMRSADNQCMELTYQRMLTAERERHHDELRDEGYEWCPECGTVLVWDLPTRRTEPRRSATPVVCGDFPPITAEDLEPAGPTPN
jgi:hypothetical protein